VGVAKIHVIIESHTLPLLCVPRKGGASCAEGFAAWQSPTTRMELLNENNYNTD